jgi:hypothetical protein
VKTPLSNRREAMTKELKNPKSGEPVTAIAATTCLEGLATLNIARARL